MEVGSILRVEGGQAGGVAEFPLVGEPVVEVAGGPSGEVHEELGEVELRIDIMPAAGGREAGEDGGSAAAASASARPRTHLTPPAPPPLARPGSVSLPRIS